MANVVRDPRQHPDAIIPDFAKPDPLLTFTKDDIALVYGSRWKQRYFKKVTIISSTLLNGMSLISYGGPTLSRTARTGGLRFTLPTISSGRLPRCATAVTP
jgi:hypothetical protein